MIMELRRMEVEHELNMMKLDQLHAELRAEMVAIYGERNISKFEESVSDGEGIQILLDKWKNKTND